MSVTPPPSSSQKMVFHSTTSSAKGVSGKKDPNIAQFCNKCEKLIDHHNIAKGFVTAGKGFTKTILGSPLGLLIWGIAALVHQYQSKKIADKLLILQQAKNSPAFQGNESLDSLSKNLLAILNESGSMPWEETAMNRFKGEEDDDGTVESAARQYHEQNQDDGGELTSIETTGLNYIALKAKAEDLYKDMQAQAHQETAPPGQTISDADVDVLRSKHQLAQAALKVAEPKDEISAKTDMFKAEIAFCKAHLKQLSEKLISVKNEKLDWESKPKSYEKIDRLVDLGYLQGVYQDEQSKFTFKLQHAQKQLNDLTNK